MDMKVLCECNSFDCKWAIDLSYEENLEAHKNGGVIIINGCSKGPDSTDILVEEKDKYSIYREG
jgi:hypothetical protein